MSKGKKRSPVRAKGPLWKIWLLDKLADRLGKGSKRVRSFSRRVKGFRKRLR